MWSYRESPLVDGDKVICTPGGEETTMVALNKLNGETIWKSQVPDRAGGGETQNRGPRGGRAMQNDPVLSTLAKDKNKEVSTDELASAPTALLELDKNKDAKISEDEGSPQRGDDGGQGDRPRRRRGPGIMRMMKANSALDADESGAIEEAEIKNAAAALRKLDGVTPESVKAWKETRESKGRTRFRGGSETTGD